MYRDTTELPEQINCIKIIDDKSLVIYNNNETAIYKLISNKYYKTETHDINTPKNEDVCYTLQQASELPSSYDFIQPIYETMAIVSVLTIIFLAYKLIIYPWFRKVQ